MTISTRTPARQLHRRPPAHTPARPHVPPSSPGPRKIRLPLHPSLDRSFPRRKADALPSPGASPSSNDFAPPRSPSHGRCSPSSHSVARRRSSTQLPPCQSSSASAESGASSSCSVRESCSQPASQPGSPANPPVARSTVRQAHRYLRRPRQRSRQREAITAARVVCSRVADAGQGLSRFRRPAASRRLPCPRSAPHATRPAATRSFRTTGKPWGPPDFFPLVLR